MPKIFLDRQSSASDWWVLASKHPDNSCVSTHTGLNFNEKLLEVHFNCRQSPTVSTIN